MQRKKERYKEAKAEKRNPVIEEMKAVVSYYFFSITTIVQYADNYTY
jgi:hypothetical protein